MSSYFFAGSDSGYVKSSLESRLLYYIVSYTSNGNMRNYVYDRGLVVGRARTSLSESSLPGQFIRNYFYF